MAYNSLPAQGSTSWYNHYADLDRATSGVVQLDSFPGANDDAKLTAALTYAAAQTYIPWIQLPGHRRVEFNQSGRTPFSGMKIMGPGSGPVTSMNREIDNGKLMSHEVRLNVGTGNNSWFASSSTLYGIAISNIAFSSSNGNSQFWHQPLVAGSNGLYACNFHNLTFFGFRHVIGQPSNPAAFTQVVTSGHWQCISPFDTQFSLRGSDNQLWFGGGMLNIHAMRTDVAGTDLMLFSSLGKTQVGYIYLTAQEASWSGVRVTGTPNCLNFYGGSYEGRNASTQASGRLFRIEGGSVGFFGPFFAYGQRNSLHNGIVEVTGGDVYMERPVYDRGSTPNTEPFIHQSGGHLAVRGAHGRLGTPLVVATGGTRDLDGTVNLG